MRALLKLESLPTLEGAADCLGQQIYSSLHEENSRLKEIIKTSTTAANNPMLELLFDPQTAGGLLASIPASEAGNCLQELERIGYTDARIIGRVDERDDESPVIEIN